jgi:uncharacterized membrane protein (DUF4010 family)
VAEAAVDEFRAVAIALAIGLLLGFEREYHEWHQHNDTQPAGTRTFATIAVSGAIAAIIDPYTVAAGAIGVAVLLAAAYTRRASAQIGATTSLAGLTTYLLGALTVTDARLAAAVAAALALLLENKGRIRALIRNVVTSAEVEDATRWFVLAFVVLPLMPSRGYGPGGVIVPSRIWELVLLLTAIGWLGYLATRAAGERRGLLIVGATGGFVSGAATTAGLARMAARDPTCREAALGGSLLASVSTLVQLAIVAMAADARFGSRMLAPMGVGLIVLGTTAALYVSRTDVGRVHVPEGDGIAPAGRHLLPRRPLALRGSVLAAAILSSAIVVSELLVRQFGESSAYAATTAVGIADVHAATLAVSSLAADGDIEARASLLFVGSALVANTLTKIVGAVAGGRWFLIRFVLLVAPTAVAVAATMVVEAQLL